MAKITTKTIRIDDDEVDLDAKDYAFYNILQEILRKLGELS